MAKDTVDAAQKRCNLKAGESQTDGLMLEGADGWTPTFFIRLVQDFGLEPEVIIDILHTFGNGNFFQNAVRQVFGQICFILFRQCCA